jgi:hypothetical protein
VSYAISAVKYSGFAAFGFGSFFPNPVNPVNPVKSSVPLGARQISSAPSPGGEGRDEGEQLFTPKAPH